MASRTKAQSEITKLSANVSSSVAQRLRRVAFEGRISESSIIELALAKLFTEHHSDEMLVDVLQKGGATLRRKEQGLS